MKNLEAVKEEVEVAARAEETDLVEVAKGTKACNGCGDYHTGVKLYLDPNVVEDWKTAGRDYKLMMAQNLVVDFVEAIATLGVEIQGELEGRLINTEIGEGDSFPPSTLN